MDAIGVRAARTGLAHQLVDAALALLELVGAEGTHVPRHLVEPVGGDAAAKVAAARHRRRHDLRVRLRRIRSEAHG
jgi:hypothetical protein